MTTTDPRLYDVILGPVITEKATNASEYNKVLFKVRGDATKPQIKEAVEKLFDVKVKSVNTLIRKGKVRRFRGKRGDLWLKFSPLQRTILEGMASAINAAGDAPVTAVVCSAPYPKTMFLEPDGSSVVGTDSFGQMSGEFLRPIALGQVRQFRALLPDNIALIGLGGVGIRAHVDQYLEMGASAVGFTTAYQIGGTEVFSYLFEEALAS